MSCTSQKPPLGEDPAEIRDLNTIIVYAADREAVAISLKAPSGEIHLRGPLDNGNSRLRTLEAMLPRVLARLKIMAELDVTNTSTPQSAVIEMQVRGRPVDMAVKTVPGPEGEGAEIDITYPDPA